MLYLDALVNKKDLGMRLGLLCIYLVKIFESRLNLSEIKM